MDIFNEIIEYLGSKDARITIYGALLGLIVVYVATKVTKALSVWKKTASANGKRSLNNFLIWLSSHYRNCPKWLKYVALLLVKVLSFFGIKQHKRYSRRNKRRKL